MGRHDLNELAARVANRTGVVNSGEDDLDVGQAGMDAQMPSVEWKPTVKGGRVDVMNKDKKPNVGSAANPTFNIEEPTWSEQHWREGQLSLDLPPTANISQFDTGNPCLDNCKQKAADVQTKCEILRQRVTDALMKGGCPTAYYPLKKTTNASGCVKYEIIGQPITAPTPVYTPQTNQHFNVNQFLTPQQQLQMQQQQMQQQGTQQMDWQPTV